MQVPCSPPTPDRCARCGAPATIAFVTPDGPAVAWCDFPHRYGRWARELPVGTRVTVPDIAAEVSNMLAPALADPELAKLLADDPEVAAAWSEAGVAEAVAFVDALTGVPSGGIAELGSRTGGYTVVAANDDAITFRHDDGTEFRLDPVFVLTTPPFWLPDDLPSQIHEPEGGEPIRRGGRGWMREVDPAAWLARAGALRCGQDVPFDDATSWFGCGEAATVAVALQSSRAVADLVVACERCVQRPPAGFHVAHTWATFDGTTWQ
jgi:hypothetical protein